MFCFETVLWKKYKIEKIPEFLTHHSYYSDMHVAIEIVTIVE